MAQRLHEIDTEIDNGPIIARAFVEKSNADTSLTLYNKIIQKELELLQEFLPSIIANNYKTEKPESKGNLYLKKDFKNLLEIDINEQLTFGEAIKKLRALTHGEFRNAYYFDPETHKKIYISINIEEE